MSRLSRSWALGLGLTLILAANALALLGAAINRAGTPESRLTLSLRELQRPYGSFKGKENSGVFLTLRWRMPVAEGEDPRLPGLVGTGGWLDAAKLAELGFDAAEAPAELGNRRQRSRTALVVLEMEGPAWQRAVAKAQARVDAAQQQAAANPGKPTASALKMAQDALAGEQTRESRLFAVDAGTDVEALRRRYPDRHRYAVVGARIHAWNIFGGGKGTPRVEGRIGELACAQIHVPVEWARQLEAASDPAQQPARQALAISVAWGQRLEPWIAGIGGVVEP